jgi:hypothetical protein
LIAFVMNDIKNNMRKAFVFILLTALMGFGMSSCTKSYTSNTGPYPNLLFAFASVINTPTVVNIDASKGGTFYGNKGVRYNIPANAFVSTSGSTTQGTVIVTATEWLKKTDMLFSGYPPYNTNYNLISAGEYYLTANDSKGNTVLPAQDQAYTATLPINSSAPPQTFLYLGGQDPQSSAVIWNSYVGDTTLNKLTYTHDSIRITTSKTGFIGAETILDAGGNPPTFTVTPELNNAVVGANDTIAAFAVYDNYNGLYVMQTKSNNVFSVNAQIPPIPVHFVVVSIINGNFYAGILAATPANGSNYVVPLTQMSPQGLKDELDSIYP